MQTIWCHFNQRTVNVDKFNELKFDRENQQIQCSSLGYRIDLHFREYKSAIEIDESDLCDRYIEYKTEKQESVEEKLSCEFCKTRINPDKESVNIHKAINEILRLIKQLSK